MRVLTISSMLEGNHKRRTLLITSQPYILYSVRDLREYFSQLGSIRVGDGTFMLLPPTSISAGRNVFHLPGEIPQH